MIAISRIMSVGYGCGYGGAYARDSNYNFKHFKILKFLAKNSSIVNFIDTAAEYGNGKSEKIIGRLSKNEKKNFFISTKVSSENLTYNRFINSVKKSLKRMKVKKIDLIQPHWPNPKVDIDETISAYRFLKKKNLVRFFGLSNYDLNTIKYCKKILKKNFRFIQDEYSICNRYIEKTKINFCLKNNINIVAYSPLGSGNLNFDVNQRKLLKKLSSKYMVTPYSIALKFLLSRSKNIIVIPNSMNKKNIISNIQSSNLQISKIDLKKINKLFTTKIIKIKLKNISYIDKKYKKITSLEDAKKNKYKFVPSPLELSKKIIDGEVLKPIKLFKDGKKYKLVDGRLRFWSYVLAFGWEYQIDAIVK